MARVREKSNIHIIKCQMIDGYNSVILYVDHEDLWDKLLDSGYLSAFRIYLVETKYYLNGYVLIWLLPRHKHIMTRFRECYIRALGQMKLTEKDVRYYNAADASTSISSVTVDELLQKIAYRDNRIKNTKARLQAGGIALSYDEWIKLPRKNKRNLDKLAAKLAEERRCPELL